MRIARTAAFLAAMLLATAPSLPAQTPPPAPVPAPAPVKPPKLIITISVDQFSADLFAEYRTYFAGGFGRLLGGVVFPSGYQSHSATETCPGHSTILSGLRPGRSGIIANKWIDQAAPRDDKTVYCAEDERVPGSSSKNYTASTAHITLPMMGERMKAADSRSRVVSVAGKDRAAIMMGGRVTDELWWWGGRKGFVSFTGRTAPPVVARTNTALAARIAQPETGLALPDICKRTDRAVPVTDTLTVGTGRFARKGDDYDAFRVSPDFDGAVLALALGMVQDMKLGKGPATDLLAIGLSATDYVGHGYGTEGSEMCLNLLSLDRNLGDFFAALDADGIDYAVVLTADHGGHDLPERNRMHGIREAARMDPALDPEAVAKVIGPKLGLGDTVLRADGVGDVWIDRSLTPAQRVAVLAEALAFYRAHPQVAAVFTRDQIIASPPPSGPPESWSLLERAKASFNPARSGDFNIALKPRITPIATPRPGGVATHGSFWDYDRRVPILFWRKGMAGFEQPLGVETVDILPTLAALIGLKIPASDIDGRCLDLDGGPETTCR